MFFLALNESDSPMLLWLLAGGLMALGPVIHSYIKVYEWFKGKSLDASQFVTRQELSVMRQERDAQIAATIADIKGDLDRVEKLMTDINRDLPAIHRALGRLEGHDDNPPRRAR